MDGSDGYLWTTDTGTGFRAVGYMRDENGLIYRGEHFEPYGETAGLGRMFKKAKHFVKKVAKSKAFKAIAKTAMSLAKSTPYGAAASAALGVAKRALRHGRAQLSEASQAASALESTATRASTSLGRVARTMSQRGTARVPLARALRAPEMREAARLVRMLPYRERARAARRVLGL